MRKTFLDFITGCVNPNEARQFTRVVGAPDDTGNFINKVKKYYDAKETPGVKKNFQDLTKKLFGVPKSPLELTAPEIDRLTNVIRDRGSQISLKIHLQPDLFVSGALPEDQQIQTIVKDFYLQNRTHFNSYKDLQYDPHEKNIHVQVRKNVAQKLFDKLGFKPEVTKQLMTGKELPNKTSRVQDVTVPFGEFFPDIADVAPHDLKQFEKSANQFLKRTGSSLQIYNEGTPKDSGFKFKGDLEDLHNLFLRSFSNAQFYPLDKAWNHRGQIEDVMNLIRKKTKGQK